MSDDDFGALGHLTREGRVRWHDHRRRHLELVTDAWIAELAELVAPAAPSGDASTRRLALQPHRTADREQPARPDPPDFG
jgi:hypothetical protein